MRAIVFLGGGRITGALLAGLRLAKYRQPIIVHDRHPRKLRDLRAHDRVVTEKDLQRAVRRARLLIVAVRPDGVQPLLQEIGQIRRPLPAVSLAAGVPLRKLRALLGPPVVWARAMPSPACRSGHGLTAVTFEKKFPVAARRELKSLFASAGPVLEIPERQFDAFTVTYSCSHGYHALASLTDAAVRLGLNRQTARLAAAHALADGILAWRATGASLGSLLHQAATPGGIAAGVMESMNSSGFRQSIQAGLKEGLRRARRHA